MLLTFISICCADLNVMERAYGFCYCSICWRWFLPISREQNSQKRNTRDWIFLQHCGFNFVRWLIIFVMPKSWNCQIHELGKNLPHVPLVVLQYLLKTQMSGLSYNQSFSKKNSFYSVYIFEMEKVNHFMQKLGNRLKKVFHIDCKMLFHEFGNFTIWVCQL